MDLILNIDTAVQTASVCLANGENVVAWKSNPEQKDSAAWLHPSIDELIKEQGIKLKDLKAVAISAGPGSYTGLRVGMAAAKGLCFALDLPLIFVNTLQMMAVAAKNAPTEWLCPMIDARRMEVFAAIFDKNLSEILITRNLILTEDSFGDLLSTHTISFFGNGSEKFQPLVHHANACFLKIESNAAHMAPLSYLKFSKGDFANLAYSEPFYGKEFYSTKSQLILRNS